MAAALPIAIWLLLGIAAIWAEATPDRGRDLSPDEVDTCNRLRAL